MDFGKPKAEFPPSDDEESEAGEDATYGEDELEEFDLDTQIEAKRIKGFGLLNRVLSIAVRTTRSGNVTSPDIGRWTSDMFLEVCNVGCSLGKNKLFRVPEIGDYDADQIRQLESFTIAAIKLSLRRPTKTACNELTDRTVGHVAMKHFGSQFSRDNEGRLWITLTGGAKMEVSTHENTKGRILSGGEEAVNFFATVTGDAYSYVEIGEIARIQAQFLLSRGRIQYPTSSSPAHVVPQLIEHSGAPPSFQKLCPKQEETHKITHELKNAVKNAYADADCRPTSIGSSKDPKGYLEYLLNAYYNKKFAVDAEYRAKKEKSVATLKSVMDIAVGDFISSGVTLDNGGSNLDVIGRLGGGGNWKVPFLPDTIGSYGAYGKAVQVSRAFRQGKDLDRKSDAYGGGFVAGATSSVPEKVRAAITELQRLTKMEKFPRVDAFGTSNHNHWSEEVKRVSTDVTFYDLREEYRQKECKFEIKDARKLAAGSGSGKFIFDDVLDILESHGRGKDKSQVNEVAKVESYIKAGYNGGFIKLYLGNKDDEKVTFGKLPTALARLSEKYHSLTLVNGGSHHSPEYYAVFSNSVNWAPPHMIIDPDTDFRHYEFTESKTKDLERQGKYLLTWITAKVYESIRSNVWINMQVANGVSSHWEFESWLRTTEHYDFVTGIKVKYGSRIDASVVDGKTMPSMDFGSHKGPKKSTGKSFTPEETPEEEVGGESVIHHDADPEDEPSGSAKDKKKKKPAKPKGPPTSVPPTPKAAPAKKAPSRKGK